MVAEVNWISMGPIRASFKVIIHIFYIGRGKARGSLPCKDLLLLAIGRGQGKRKYPVVQTLATAHLDWIMITSPKFQGWDLLINWVFDRYVYYNPTQI